MGLVRLAVQNRDRIAPDGLDRVIMCGPDDLHGELPWFAQAYFSGNDLVVERSENDSGWVIVPWRVTGHGELMISTATLCERDKPYQLEVELARGAVNRLRNFMFHWEMMGLDVPEKLRETVSQATTEFSRAATKQSDPKTAAEHAERAISSAVGGMYHLVEVYNTQAISVRRVQSKQFGTLLGIQVGERMPDLAIARQLPEAFNMAAMRSSWGTIESNEGKRSWDQIDSQLQWAQVSGMRVSIGPLLEFSDRSIPDWAYLWEGDFDAIRNFMLDHVRRVVQRYQGKVQLWQVASRMCCGRVLGLSEEQRLQIVAQAIAAAREIDSRTPIVISFDHPWGEYLATQRLDLAPLHFADALVRADLGLSGLAVEINVGYQPNGSSLRTPLSYSRLIDYWSLLELPLLVSLTVPSSSAEDPAADPKIHTIGQPPSGELSPDSQNDWIQKHIPLLLAKSNVQVILMNQLTDSTQHEFPHGGLFDANAEAKPVFNTLRKIRKEYLN